MFVMKDNAPDDRRKSILNAAWQAFADYGFRKTSMDDIARGAGMSRAALYLHFRNKEDIYRTLVAHYYEEAEIKFSEALAIPGPVGAVLVRALLAKSGPAVEAMLNSPHGHELLDAKTRNAVDITMSGEARLASVLAGWLAAQEMSGAVSLPAPAAEVARVVMAALKGLMTQADSHEGFVADVGTLGSLLGQGLEEGPAPR